MAPQLASKSILSLLKGVNCRKLYGDGEQYHELQVLAVTSDSREVKPGFLFVALRGVGHDGHDFIEDAIAKGCVAVVFENGVLSKERIGAAVKRSTLIAVENCHIAYALVVTNYYDRPAENLKLIGVTGTNGKTTVTYLLEHVLLESGLCVGVIGTINNRYTGRDGNQIILSTHLTTPEAHLLQEVLREMVDAGVSHVIMEVSSHALAQARVGGVLFDVVAMTNLSRDHLDYHQTMAEYFKAKVVLFEDHVHDHSIAVLPVCINENDRREWLVTLRKRCQKTCEQIISWGEAEGADVRLAGFSLSLCQTELAVYVPDGVYKFSTPLVGRFNIDNVLTVFALSIALRVGANAIVKALSTAKGAPGRVERVQAKGGNTDRKSAVFVDYAHTPDALEKVLETVNALPHGNLYCVFGCGGDRDKGKRPLMGRIASRLSDVVIVTDDNPRTENSEQIIQEILSGLDNGQIEEKNREWLLSSKREGRGYVVIQSRRQAIESAIEAAGIEDIVVIAGKGHEPYQITSKGKRFFDDRLIAENTQLRWTQKQVETAVGGVVPSAIESCEMLGKVVTDSRVKGRKNILVALKGESHDAHDFAEQAVENGATCLVVERKIADISAENASQVVVKDTQKALGDLAAYRRQKFKKLRDQKIIGITGSCGKTTVKEMVAAILERVWPAGTDYPENCVLKTQGNFNNLIGLPLSLLPLELHHKAAVLEMGMNQPGELRKLAEIADPDISCIVNIHGAHLEGLGSIEGVAKAKEELFAATKATGILVVNLDDPRVRALSAAYSQEKITFAVSSESAKERADIWASDIHCKVEGVITFTLHHKRENVKIHLYTAGQHNVSNGLAAAAISLAAGADFEQVRSGLADFRPPDKRMQMVRGTTGYAILNDTYNANPASMAAGLKTLKQMSKKRSIALIGAMLELGSISSQAHYEIGRLVGELQIDFVGIVGEFKEDVLRGAIENGCEEGKIEVFKDKEALVLWMQALAGRIDLGTGDLVLVKASRGLQFETIIEDLVEQSRDSAITAPYTKEPDTGKR